MFVTCSVGERCQKFMQGTEGIGNSETADLDKLRSNTNYNQEKVDT